MHPPDISDAFSIDDKGYSSNPSNVTLEFSGKSLNKLVGVLENRNLRFAVWQLETLEELSRFDWSQALLLGPFVYYSHKG